MCKKKSPNEFTGEDVINTGFNPQSENAITWKGYEDQIIGEQCEKHVLQVFNLDLDKINVTYDAKTPDWIDCDGKYIIEVFAGRSEGKLDEEMTEKMGVPYKVDNNPKRELRKKIRGSLQHAKKKNLDYVIKECQLSEKPTHIAFYSIQIENRYWIDDWNVVTNLVKNYDLDEYGVDCLVVYAAPSMAFSSKTMVFYKKGKTIDPKIFKYAVEMIELP